MTALTSRWHAMVTAQREHRARTQVNSVLNAEPQVVASVISTLGSLSRMGGSRASRASGPGRAVAQAQISRQSGLAARGTRASRVCVSAAPGWRKRKPIGYGGDHLRCRGASRPSRSRQPVSVGCSGRHEQSGRASISCGPDSREVARWSAERGIQEATRTVGRVCHGWSHRALHDCSSRLSSSPGRHAPRWESAGALPRAACCRWRTGRERAIDCNLVFRRIRWCGLRSSDIGRVVSQGRAICASATVLEEAPRRASRASSCRGGTGARVGGGRCGWSRVGPASAMRW